MRSPRLAPRLFVTLIAALWLTGCGGGSSAKSTTPDFALTVAPTNVSIIGGASGQPVHVTATAINSFAAPVNVKVTALPSGVAASPSALMLNPGIAQTITFTANASVATGSATITLTGASGMLTHIATLSMTTTAVPPNFMLSVAPTSQTLVTGGSSAAFSLLATPSNGFTSPVSVTIAGLPTGVTATPATLTLTPGTAQSVTLAASPSATIGAATLTFTGTSGPLSQSATLALMVQAPAIPDVTTYHFDNARDGLNEQETALTPANVNSTTFGSIRFLAGDGKIDAQPLYLAGFNVNGTGTNVLYMASEHDSVYAFNADTGAQIWKTSVLGSGEGTSDDHGCSQISPEIGITSTPVIDRAKGATFVVGMSKDAAGIYHQRLHALSLTTGAELAGSPVEVTGSYPGTGVNSQNGNVIFDPGQYDERAGLLLLNGKIYLAWGSHCDESPYTGWVMAYDENTLQQTAILNLTPNGSDGSIWMSGDGLAADAAGNIYLLDANGTFDTTYDSSGFPINHDFGNAALKLSTTNGTLAVADYFEPWNTITESAGDIDLGSGGVMLLPDLTDATGNVRHLMVGAGKDEHLYVVNRDNMGKINLTAQNNSNAYGDFVPFSDQTFSTPAFFNGTLYYGSQNQPLKAFSFVQAQMSGTPSSQTAVTFSMRGTTPFVSANGTQNAIVWALESDPFSPNVLHAYDATNLGKELYNSNQAPNGRDSFGYGNKFIAPVVVNGKVFIGTQNGVAEFGLLP